MTAAVAIAAAVTGVAETRPDVLEFMTECVQCDHEGTVGDETALTAVAVRADQIVQFAVSVLVVCLLGFDCARVDIGHTAVYGGMVYNRDARRIGSADLCPP